eukprot:1003747-Rhodomonas_salina.7
MSGTDLAYSATGLRACYAMSGTDPVYRAIRQSGARGKVASPIVLRLRYAMSCTDVAFTVLY